MNQRTQEAHTGRLFKLNPQVLILKNCIKSELSVKLVSDYLTRINLFIQRKTHCSTTDLALRAREVGKETF